MSNKKNSYQMVTLKKVFRYIKRYIPLLIVALTLSVVTVALTLYFPILTGRAIDLIIGEGQVDFTAILDIIVKALIVVIGAAIAQWFTNICNNKMTYNVIRDIRADAFCNIEKIPLSYIDSQDRKSVV